MVNARFALVAAAAAACAAPSLGAGKVVSAAGAWAAIDRGASCEALSRSLRIAPRGKVQAAASIAFTPDHRRWGEFHARLSRVVRPGTTVMLIIDGRPFLLFARGIDAWSSGPQQEQAIISALREAGAMRVEARDSGGQRFADPYALAGAPTAIDSAAARCALLGAGKIR